MKNKVITEEKNLKLVSTAPVCDKEKYGEYANILHQQVMVSDVYNIGIIAPYGAGKSSLIKTYKDTKYNWFNRKKVTTISLANFNVSSDSKSEDDDYAKHIQDIECNVEKSILQQFIYKVNKSKLPHSRLDRIDNRHWWLSLTIALMMTATIALVCCGVLECLNILPHSQGQNFYYFFGAAAVSVLGLLFLLLYSHRLNKISIKDIETEISSCNNASVLNTFIDELIYYFSKTKVEIVVIEDLDRFNNTNLFAKLREINFLINNSEIVKQKVTFIYAVKDSLFKSENDRAKFFDFIISLVPILSFTNARKLLDEELKKLCSEEMWLPESYVYEVSHFITEMRILKNVINDYIMYYKILKVEGFPQKDKNIKLFALALYKNLRPADFAELQFGKGELANYFDLKDKQIKDDIKKLRDDIRKLEERKEKAKEVRLTSLANFKSLLKGMIIDNHQSSVDYSVPYQDIGGLKSFKGISGGLTFSHYYTYNCTIKKLEEKLGDTLENIEQAIYDKEELNLNALDVEIETKRNYIKDLVNYSMQEFLKFHENFIGDDLTNFLLVNGYITEDFKEFVAHVDQELLSANDGEFVRNVLAKRMIEYGLKLDNAFNVIREIQPERFSDKYVLNYDLVKCLLDYSGDKKDLILKKQNLKTFFSLMDSSVKTFLESYINDGQELSFLIKEIAPNNNSFTYEILKNLKISEDKKKLYVKVLLQNFKPEQILNQDVCSVLTDYLNNNEDVIDDIGSINKPSFKSVSLKLKLSIGNLKCKVENYDVANFLVENRLFEINYSNLQFITCVLKSVGSEEFELAPLSNIYDFNDSNFVNYINENLEKSIELLVNQDKQYEDTQETLELVLNNKKLSQELCKKFIDKQNRSYNYYDSINKDILQYMFDKNKISVNWDNIIKAKKSGLITITGILNYLNNNANELGCESLEDKEIILMLCNKIAYSSLKGFAEFSKAFDVELTIQEITEDNVSAILVKNGKILSNEISLKSSVNRPLTLAQLLIKDNSLADLINANSFTNKTIESVFLNTSLTTLIRKRLLKTSHFLPESEEAIIKVKDVLMNDSIGHCEKSLLNLIVKNEIISKSDKLAVLRNNDRSLNKNDLFALLCIVDPKLNSLQDIKEQQRINTGELDNEVLNFLEAKNLFKVTRFQRVTKLVKLF